MQHTETITWHPVPGPALPDSDTTVLIEIDPTTPHSEPVWPGYLDGEQWRTAEGDLVAVVSWAQMPGGQAATGVDASRGGDA